MEYFLYTIFFLSCIVLIAAVLLQPGKTDAGALFTSNVSSSALAPRGTATILSKVTITAAALFMVSALLLSMPALTGNVSVLSSNPDAPANTDSNSNTSSVDSNSNTSTQGPDSNTAAPAALTPATPSIAPSASPTDAKPAPAKTEPAKAPAKATK